jgi:hypothetical protein
MAISDLLVTEFDQEVNKTRAMLERVPDGKTEFAPHPKSMTLGRLAPHVAELAGFGLTVLTTSGMDFSSGEYNPLPSSRRRSWYARSMTASPRCGTCWRSSRTPRGPKTGVSRIKDGRFSTGRASSRIVRCSSTTSFIIVRSSACTYA